MICVNLETLAEYVVQYAQYLEQDTPSNPYYLSQIRHITFCKYGCI
jgi:hypothetical protein